MSEQETVLLFVSILTDESEDGEESEDVARTLLISSLLDDESA